MYAFSYRWPVRWWALLIGLALNISVSHAQLGSVAAITKPSAPAGTLLQYRSVFTHYQGFSDQPIAPWADTNATVEKIGGWRAYAKEAQEPEAAENIDKASSPANTSAHGEHGKQP